MYDLVFIVKVVHFHIPRPQITLRQHVVWNDPAIANIAHELVHRVFSGVVIDIIVR